MKNGIGNLAAYQSNCMEILKKHDVFHGKGIEHITAVTINEVFLYAPKCLELLIGIQGSSAQNLSAEHIKAS